MSKHAATPAPVAAPAPEVPVVVAAEAAAAKADEAKAEAVSMDATGPFRSYTAKSQYPFVLPYPPHTRIETGKTYELRESQFLTNQVDAGYMSVSD